MKKKKEQFKDISVINFKYFWQAYASIEQITNNKCPYLNEGRENSGTMNFSIIVALVILVHDKMI